MINMAYSSAKCNNKTTESIALPRSSSLKDCIVRFEKYESFRKGEQNTSSLFQSSKDPVQPPREWTGSLYSLLYKPSLCLSHKLAKGNL